MRLVFLTMLTFFTMNCLAQKNSNKYVKRGIEPRSEKDVVWQNYLKKIEENKILKNQSKSDTLSIEKMPEKQLLENNDKEIENQIPEATFIIESKPLYKIGDSIVEILEIEEFINRHIKNNFTYPDFAREYEIQGRVIANLKIDKEGKLQIIDIRSPKYGLILEEEVIRILNLIPKAHAPAYHNEKPVNLIFSVPFVFKLE